MSDVAAELARAVASIDGLLEPVVDHSAILADGPPALAAGGPRTAADRGAYRLALEQIREGHLLHGGGGRVVAGADPDLMLLAGDALYAGGLALIAELGDLEAIAELSRLIARCATARAAGRPDDAEAAWVESCAAIGGLA